MSTPSPDRHEQQPTLELEIEVPGTPEQVWQAIATGPGISSWIQPTTVEEREGGTFTFDMGGGTQTGTVAAWEPPHRFRQETTWGNGESLPPTVLATEWIIEARSGSTCVVRMVTSGFGTEGDWADEFDGFAESMRTSLANLQLYLGHFAGRSGTWIRAAASGLGDRDEAWRTLIAELGISPTTSIGDDVTTSADVRLSGVVEKVVEGRWRRDLVLRIDEPAPGFATISVWGTEATALVQASLFGPTAESVVAAEQPRWQSWLQDRLPAGPSGDRDGGMPRSPSGWPC